MCQCVLRASLASHLGQMGWPALLGSQPISSSTSRSLLIAFESQRWPWTLLPIIHLSYAFPLKHRLYQLTLTRHVFFLSEHITHLFQEHRCPLGSILQSAQECSFPPWLTSSYLTIRLNMWGGKKFLYHETSKTRPRRLVRRKSYTILAKCSLIFV